GTRGDRRSCDRPRRDRPAGRRHRRGPRPALGRHRLERPHQPDVLRHLRPAEAVRLPLRGRREAHAAGALRGPGGGVQRHPREGRARRVPAARARALGHHAAGLTVLFDRDRARRRGPGRYQVKLRPNERALVADLVGQLREQLLASTDDPAVRRLFPPAYPDDAERDAGYQVLTRDTLLEQRLAALDTVEQSLDGRELDEGGMTAWMTTLNALRLVLGTRLDVDEEPPALDPSDPMAPAYAVYEFLGWLLSQVVDVLSADLPPAAES